MAKRSAKRTSYKMSYRSFEGINLTKIHSGDESISLIENFRIADDRSLKKRFGYKKIGETAIPASQAFRAIRDGQEIFYLLCQNLILKYTPHNDSITPISSISSFESAHFFEYLGNIYLCTDNQIYEINENGLTELNPYIPLYGKNWPSSKAGEPNEPINILCDKVMISYKFTEGSHGFLSFGDLNFVGIDSIYRNGIRMSTDKYSYDEEYKLIALTEHADTDEFVAILNISQKQDYINERNEILRTRASSVFYEIDTHNLLLWGNPSNNKVFYSKSTDPETYNFVKRFAQDTSAFYIPKSSFFTVDKPTDRIKSIIRHYDRVLIMTESSTWMTDLQQLASKDFQIKSINASLGCSTLGGAIRINNNIISLGKNSVFCWTSNTDELNECNAYSITEHIQSIISENFFKNCIITVDNQNSEIWFHNRQEKITWIYNTKQSAWYKYTGFEADILFNSSSAVIFSSGKNIFRFDSSLYYDNAEEIKSVFKTGELEFNTFKYKKLNLIVFRGEFTSGIFSVKITLDNKESIISELQLSSEHSVLAFRIRTGSFKVISVELSSLATGEQTLHGMELYAN